MCLPLARGFNSVAGPLASRGWEWGKDLLAHLLPPCCFWRLEQSWGIRLQAWRPDFLSPPLGATGRRDTGSLWGRSACLVVAGMVRGWRQWMWSVSLSAGHRLERRRLVGGIPGWGRVGGGWERRADGRALGEGLAESRGPNRVQPVVSHNRASQAPKALCHHGLGTPGPLWWVPARQCDGFHQPENGRPRRRP